MNPKCQICNKKKPLEQLISYSIYQLVCQKCLQRMLELHTRHPKNQKNTIGVQS